MRQLAGTGEFAETEAVGGRPAEPSRCYVQAVSERRPVTGQGGNLGRDKGNSGKYKREGKQLGDQLGRR